MYLKKLLLVLALILGVQNVSAQIDSTTATKQEVWPGLNLYYKFNKKVRLLLLYSASRLQSSDNTDGATGLYVDYFAVPWLGKIAGLKPLYDSTPGVYVWLRFGYGYSYTRVGVEPHSTESKFVTQGTFRFNLPYRILLSQRNNFDWVVDDGDLKHRYRGRLKFEKHMHTEYLTFIPYLYGEYFMNADPGNPDAYRFGWGFEVKITRMANFETYHVHQFNIGNGVKAFDAIGVNLNVYLSHAAMKAKFSKRKPLDSHF